MKIPKPILPTDEEMTISSNKWWDVQKGVNFLDWNKTLINNSIPFEAVKVPNGFVREFLKIYDGKLSQDEWGMLESEFSQMVYSALNKHGWLTGFFAKLITRSPKDAMDGKMIFNSAGEAFKTFANSMRIFDDMCMFYHLDKCHIIVRPYVEIPKWTEWRILVWEKEIAGISQYHYNEYFELPKSVVKRIEQEIRMFINLTVTPNMSIESFCADVIVDIKHGKSLLLETNPYGLSDPCLFVSYDKLDGSFKYKK